MPDIDEGSGLLPTSAAIDVDVSGLERFAGSVESEVNANFRPQASNIMKVHAAGSHFGLGHSSVDVRAARDRHNECLQAAVDQLAGYANAAHILIEAARAVAARYREADALAAANAAEVEQALTAATVRAMQAQAAAAPVTPDEPPRRSA
jgi:hypothetical protein